ncbi:MAG: hypothetical protein ACYS7Y_04085 [Planctomycetota bacterium]|jgi:hypothetical protein
MKRYKIVVKITKGDITADILNLMTSGLVISYDTMEEACAALDNFRRVAGEVVSHGRFRTYGMTCILNEQDGDVHFVQSLFNEKGTN